MVDRQVFTVKFNLFGHFHNHGWGMTRRGPETSPDCQRGAYDTLES